MIHVTKAGGTKEAFSEEKVINSIRHAHIPEPIQSETLAHVQSKLYDGISTSEIYHHITEFLDQSPQPYTKARYSLKESIMMLGPTGYPFEDFVAKILEALGYTTTVRQILSGKCVTHEIDVIAKKDGKTSAIEAKFHNSPGSRSEVHVALYTQARFQDIKDRNAIDDVWLITNTKTTTDANTYAHCVGMKVISWSYPEGEGLRDLIEKVRLHPITLLTSLSQASKLKLLQNHIVMCKEINQTPSILNTLGLSKTEKEQTLAEAAFICRNENDFV